MRQLDLAYAPSHIGRVAWRGDDDDSDVPGGMLGALHAAVEYLGRKEVIFELNIAKSTLSEALKETNDKRWAAEWTCKVLAMLTLRGDEKSAQLQHDIIASMTALAPRFAVTDAYDGPTDEEIAAAERLLAAARKRKRPR